MAKYQFSVDHFSDDKSARTQLLHLRRMARLGKVAERALADIERQGYTNKLLPVAVVRKEAWRQQNGGLPFSHDVQHVRFRQREDISRADLGPMDQIHVEFGSMKDGYYSAFKNKEAPVSIKGPFRRQVNAQGQLVTENLSVEIGKVRINKSHLSFVEGSYNGTAWQVYKSIKVSPHALAAYKGIAICVAKAIVDTAPNIAKSARVHDLQTNAPDWLVEDGHIERLCQEIHSTIKILEVMEA